MPPTQAGITAIHQETVLFDELTVAENIFLGHAPRGRLGPDRLARDARAGARDPATGIGADIDPATPLRELGIASKHLVAIARALSVDARVVIMDEPTAALSHKEIEELYELVERLKAEGKAILFISHKFDEIFRIADRYTVFRDGELVGDGLIADVTEDRAGADDGRPRRSTRSSRKRARRLGRAGAARSRGYCHPTEFDDIRFTLRRGRDPGLLRPGRRRAVGVDAGAVRHDAAVPGRVPRSTAGSLVDPLARRRDRQRHRLRARGSRHGRARSRRCRSSRTSRCPRWRAPRAAASCGWPRNSALAREYTERLDLRAASLDQDVGTLSGGNQQKVVIAKWLATRPRVIILDEPTKGIDIGSKAAVHDFMAELAAEGLAVIMVSSEIPEIMRHVRPRHRHARGPDGGRVRPATALTPETLVRAAAGIGEEEPAHEPASLTIRARRCWRAAIVALLALIAARFPGFVAPGEPRRRLQRHLAADHAGARPDGGDPDPLHRPVGRRQPGADAAWSRRCSTSRRPACRSRSSWRSRIGLGALRSARSTALLVWKLDIPPIVVTLGTMTIYRGSIFLLSGGKWVNATR